MNIQILTRLEKARKLGGKANRGLPIEQIEALELSYNAGNPFPKALRELLFIAGEYCICLDYYSTMEKMQIECRSLLNSTSLATLGNFLCIDANLGFGNECFLFVYGNDPNPDPMVNVLDYSGGSITLNQEVCALSEFLNDGIEAVEQGLNPF